MPESYSAIYQRDAAPSQPSDTIKSLVRNKKNELFRIKSSPTPRSYNRSESYFQLYLLNVLTVTNNKSVLTTSRHPTPSSILFEKDMVHWSL
ncbi:hypothetical protein RRG08_026005 [Elysia crispata]|uniref:Uncharacterized protein n=1 Tax=Elysia crispata TaxID=231223 RepID=A0AAE1B6T3_9GAST|nr:hypothetical protein RRG08_026005 [Elysia crispata]